MSRAFWAVLPVLCLTTLFWFLPAPQPALAGETLSRRPADIIDIRRAAPSVLLDIRYYSRHNFVGRPVEGYLAPKCLLTQAAARALAGVQADLKAYGLSMKIYDCYRPQRAVNHFIRWAKDLKDTTRKTEFYPKELKSGLFKRGYIASRSGHSRGSTVDLTIVALPPAAQPPAPALDKQCPCTAPVGRRFADNSLDMGVGFDCFDALSHTANPNIPARARQNRLLLKTIMARHGFVNYDKEWWHYTFKPEPYPDTYFDFPVE